MKKKILITAGILFLALVIFMGIDFFGLPGGESVTVYIEEGTAPSTIYTRLSDNDVIMIKPLFSIYAKGKSSEFKSGEHTFRKHMSYGDVIAELTSNGKTKYAKTFTVPEGYELREIALKLEKEGIKSSEEFIRAANEVYDYDFLPPYKEGYLEGYLFPDTYNIDPSLSCTDIVNMMLKRFGEIYIDEYYKRGEEIGMSVQEVIILASIIEREAAVPEERALVSSVFHNRLKSDKYPYLQSCATVQYILEERKDILSNADIAIDSPYNTYKYKGLPPGPIASPGKACIEAALYPADTNYYFFVSNGDGTQTFSETFEEHNRSGVNAQ